jgi:tripartite-type tricarboxylate transporter receptor subunit TctC
VPTFKEQGYDLVSTSWYSLFAPARLPEPVLSRLSAAGVSALANAALRRRMVEMGLQPTGHGPDRLAAILKADHDRWGETIRESGCEAER